MWKLLADSCWPINSYIDGKARAFDRYSNYSLVNLKATRDALSKLTNIASHRAFPIKNVSKGDGLS